MHEVEDMGSGNSHEPFQGVLQVFCPICMASVSNVKSLATDATFTGMQSQHCCSK